MGRRKGYTHPDDEKHFNSWVAKQSLPVEAAIKTVTSAVRNAVIGFFADVYINGVPSSFDPQTFPVPGGFQPLAHSYLGGGSLIVARNFAVTAGVNAGICCVLNRIKGKKDVKTEMVAGFSAGILLALVTGMRGPSVISVGVFHGLTNVGVFKVNFGGGTPNFHILIIIRSVYKNLENIVPAWLTHPFKPVVVNPNSVQVKEKMSQKRVSRLLAEDIWYKETRHMLSSLGLGHYEKNFKNGLLYDKTLPLLIESALQDVGIPIGPSLLILDHIHREEVKKRDSKVEE